MIKNTIRFALSCVGLSLRADYLRMMGSAYDHQSEVARLSIVNTELTKANADLRYAVELHKRESSAHARSAQDHAARLKTSETDRTIAENRLLVAERLDVGASAVGILGPCGGKFSHYMLQLGVKNGDKYTAVELRRLVASTKNRQMLEEIAGRINTACERRPLARRLEEAGLSEVSTSESKSLLRPATPAPVFDNGGKPVPMGVTKPKGFA